MLILTRRLGETIHIGDDVVVTVLGVRGHQVRLGIEAPQSVRVNRGELAHHRSVEVPTMPSLADADDILPFADTLGMPVPVLGAPLAAAPAAGPGTPSADAPDRDECDKP